MKHQKITQFSLTNKKECRDTGVWKAMEVERHKGLTALSCVLFSKESRKYSMWDFIQVEHLSWLSAAMRLDHLHFMILLFLCHNIGFSTVILNGDEYAIKFFLTLHSLLLLIMIFVKQFQLSCWITWTLPVGLFILDLLLACVVPFRTSSSNRKHCGFLESEEVSGS